MLQADECSSQLSGRNQNGEEDLEKVYQAFQSETAQIFLQRWYVSNFFINFLSPPLSSPPTTRVHGRRRCCCRCRHHCRRRHCRLRPSRRRRRNWSAMLLLPLGSLLLSPILVPDQHLVYELRAQTQARMDKQTTIVNLLDLSVPI